MIKAWSYADNVRTLSARNATETYLHVLADRVVLNRNRDVEGREAVLRTDTRQKEDLGRVGGARGEDDLLGDVQVVHRGWIGSQ